ncbi:MAG: D-erythronate dehydrogenase [Pseudomonadota bacterium]
MRILITGAAGFLGRMLSARLAAEGALGGVPISGLTLMDVVAPEPVAGLPCDCVTADLATAAYAPHDVVVHLAAVVSSEAEADLEKGLAVNLDGTRRLLDATRGWGRAPVVLFASSVAVFSCAANEVITDATEPKPRSSYGAQKLMGEVLVRDLSRRGVIRGRTLRFPTIAVRPGRPNKAASSFASSILREPLKGEAAVLPVPETTRLHLMSPAAAVEAMLRALVLEQEALEGETTITLPGLSVSVAEMLAGLEDAAPGARALVRAERDAGVEAIVASWPGGIAAPRAERLGFAADADFATLLARSRAHL